MIDQFCFVNKNDYTKMCSGEFCKSSSMCSCVSSCNLFVYGFGGILF